MLSLVNTQYIQKAGRVELENFNGKNAGEVSALLSFKNAQHSAETCIDFIELTHDKSDNIIVNVYDYDSSNKSTHKYNSKEFNGIVDLFKEFGADTDKVIEDLKALPRVKKKFKIKPF